MFQKLSGHILIVDDEELLRYILKMYLEDFGLTVDEAENGKVALEKAQQNKYDVIITDMNMPQMRGDQLLEELEIRGYLKTKVLVITGGSEDGLRQLQIGFITKPYTKGDIYLQLNACLSA